MLRVISSCMHEAPLFIIIIFFFFFFFFTVEEVLFLRTDNYFKQQLQQQNICMGILVWAIFTRFTDCKITVKRFSTFCSTDLSNLQSHVQVSDMICWKKILQGDQVHAIPECTSTAAVTVASTKCVAISDSYKEAGCWTVCWRRDPSPWKSLVILSLEEIFFLFC